MFLLIYNYVILKIITTIIYYILRYINYKFILLYKYAINYNEPLNLDFDNMYNDFIKNTNIKKDIENDNRYNNIIEDSYNILHIRKLPWSHKVDVIIKLADIKDGYHILDAGCGDGNVSIYLCQQFPNLKCSCIINNTILYNILQENIKKNNLTNRINVYLMNFDNLSLPVINMKFDRILFIESIDYSINRNKLLQSVKLLLNPTGKLFIKTLIFKNNLSKKKYKNCEKIITQWHYNFSTISSLLNDLKINKYKNIKYIDYKSINMYFHLNLIEDIKVIINIFKNKIINKIDNMYNLFFYLDYICIIAEK